MFRRISLLVVLMAWLAGGCGRPDVGAMMKKSMERSMPQKTLSHTDWTGAERVVLFVPNPHGPVAAGVSSGFSLGASAKGAAVGAAAGAAALSTVPGAGVLAGALVGLIIPSPRKLSDEAFKKSVMACLGEDYAAGFARKVEQALKSQAKGQVMLVTGSPESWKSVDLKPTDSVINVFMMLMFIGDEPQMLAQLHWNIVVKGDRYQEIAQQMEAKTKELQQKRAKAKEYLSLWDSYDGHGTLIYSSPGYSAKKWFVNDGELLLSEWRQATDQLIRQLQQALAGGKSH